MDFNYCLGLLAFSLKNLIFLSAPQTEKSQMFYQVHGFFLLRFKSTSLPSNEFVISVTVNFNPRTSIGSLFMIFMISLALLVFSI